MHQLPLRIEVPKWSNQTVDWRLQTAVTQDEVRVQENRACDSNRLWQLVSLSAICDLTRPLRFPNDVGMWIIYRDTAAATIQLALMDIIIHRHREDEPARSARRYHARRRAVLRIPSLLGTADCPESMARFWQFLHCHVITCSLFITPGKSTTNVRLYINALTVMLSRKA